MILKNSSSLPLSLTKLRCRDVSDSGMYILPSPYSTEDLLLVHTEHTQPATASHEQIHNPIHSLQHRSSAQGCTHGYTHIHSQCTIVSSFKTESRSTPGVQINAFNLTANTLPVRLRSYYPPQQHQQRDARPHASSYDTSNFSGLHILSTGNLNGQSRSSLRPCHRSSSEEQPPVQAGNLHPCQQTTPLYSPTMTIMIFPLHHITIMKRITRLPLLIYKS